ncbi:MAG: hypothetical protein H7Y36_12400 [Armatimonadetes bacterium]|nr:hypothetical protein [Akkermansiaceae bacterium]
MAVQVFSPAFVRLQEHVRKSAVAFVGLQEHVRKFVTAFVRLQEQVRKFALAFAKKRLLKHPSFPAESSR